MKSEIKNMLLAARQGDKKAREKLITDNTGLVWSIVKRFRNRGYEEEDLFQLGIIGLVKAIDNFNVNMDLELSTYAVHLIQGEIKRFIRDDGMVKVSRTLKENAWKIRKASQDLAQRLGREPTMSELENETQLPGEDIVMAIEANREVESIYQSVYQSDGNEIFLVDQLMDKEQSQGDAVLDHIMLEQLLGSLKESERCLIKMRYFQEKTQTQVAEALGVSQVQVSRLEKKILEKLRKMI